MEFAKGQRAVVTMNADKSAATMLFAQGHDMLEQFRRDAVHPQAPESIRNLEGQTAGENLMLVNRRKLFDGVPGAHNIHLAACAMATRPRRDCRMRSAKFGVWLTELYPNEATLNVRLTPAMRAVFDQMHS